MSPVVRKVDLNHASDLTVNPAWFRFVCGLRPPGKATMPPGAKRMHSLRPCTAVSHFKIMPSEFAGSVSNVNNEIEKAAPVQKIIMNNAKKKPTRSKKGVMCSINMIGRPSNPLICIKCLLPRAPCLPPHSTSIEKKIDDLMLHRTRTLYIQMFKYQWCMILSFLHAQSRPSAVANPPSRNETYPSIHPFTHARSSSPDAWK